MEMYFNKLEELLTSQSNVNKKVNTDIILILKAVHKLQSNENNLKYKLFAIFTIQISSIILIILTNYWLSKKI